MTAQTATAPAATEKAAEPGTSAEKMQQQIHEHHANKNLDGVCSLASSLARTLDQTQQQVQGLSTIHNNMREKLEALTARENYPVTITGVQNNGSLSAEVAGVGNSRVQVSVHPDVDPQQLVVGATAILSRQRNCLLKVTASTGRWQHVGTFERYIDSSNRILIRDHDTLVAVDVAHHLRDTLLKKSDLVGYDRDVAGIAYQRLESPGRDHLFDENVTDDFSQLGGLDKEIALIKRHIDFLFRFPDLATKYNLKSKCGILLKGAPGNGKTRIARCCAGYVRELFPDRPCRFMHVAGSSDYTMWFGESERKISERFHAAREAAKDGLVIMFWDEVDAIAKRRGTDHGSGAPDRILNTFFSELDGVVPLENVMVVFATNRAEMLDPGFLRAGRTDEIIEIPTPNRRATQAILNRYLGCGLPLAAAHDSAAELASPIVSRLFAPNGDYAKVAEVKLSDGRSLPVAGRQLLNGAMLENVVKAAAKQAAVREAETGQEGISEEDLASVLDAELVAAVSLLAPENVKSYVTSIPQDAQPLAVDPLLRSPMSSYTR